MIQPTRECKCNCMGFSSNYILYIKEQCDSETLSLHWHYVVLENISNYSSTHHYSHWT